MENVIVTIFNDESATYQALSELKHFSGTSSVLVAGILKNDNGHIIVKDGFNLDRSTDQNWISGALIGGLVGILGGPIGMLFGSSIGMMVGTAVDSSNTIDNYGLVTEAVSKLGNYHLCLVALVDEMETDELDHFFGKYNPSAIIRKDVCTVQTEICQAQELEKKLRKETHEHMREEKKQEWHEKAKEIESSIKEKFRFLKKDHK